MAVMAPTEIAEKNKRKEVSYVWVVQCQEEEMYFSKSPKDVTVVLGQSVTLPCEVTPDNGVRCEHNEYYSPIQRGQ
ncbi:unnamed protein product [Phaedon cochleariae]|uniref:Uncharacterized protein n=1 Tax=Phaedon cochleariae TaxID=80249 RepID=A0A9N9SLL6_PHACE|nr:unnamed protein product [Phaedon cochleariae]